ncbi:hypothetical protein PsorP6_009539 [Peronosclerospora sorghi]|uniref:Uncharacterized protein n=1 Tax=Peronosclerospora sorghi TaxID=230839 RepID=A0ACC0W1V0_9STRA|nr:hypothetical protein PsorP6_009539 [Peronosclerospora sorghi]
MMKTGKSFAESLLCLVKAYARGVGAKEAIWEVHGGESFKKLLQMKRELERWNLRWGGDLTERGKQQGEALAQSFRNSLYPVEVEEGGLLRLHSTLRHDLKIFTSDEGRVQMTTAAFAKGFLELEGDLTPILVSLVTTLDRDANKMLDHSGQAYAMDEMHTIKAKLKTLLQREYSSFEEMKALIAPLNTESIVQSLEIIKNPKEALVRLLEPIRKLRGEIAEHVPDKPKTDTFNLSKIPDVHDCIKYDLFHNSSVSWKCGLDLVKLSEALARCYVSQEYGMDIDEKQSIGNRVSQALAQRFVLML